MAIRTSDFVFAREEHPEQIGFRVDKCGGKVAGFNEPKV
jgi:hypothetical protein